MECISGFKIKLKTWEDGQLVEQDIDTPDRWTIHASEQLSITFGDKTVALQQRPQALNATRIGVGACLWEGELLLAAYLAEQPLHRYIGARCVELGAGPGLAGLLLARLGAHVVLTDKAAVLPIIEDNIKLNGLAPGAIDRGSAQVQPLEWGAPGYMDAVATLAADGVDLVIAADCCYIDNELPPGESPSTAHFVAAAAGLCAARGGGGGGAATASRCLVSFELRSQEVKDTFLREAAAAFKHVARVPPEKLPRGCRVQHIELYELSQPVATTAVTRSCFRQSQTAAALQS